MIPGYWQNETSGVLRPAIEAYLRGQPLSAEHIAAIRAYLRQWIMAPGWAGGPDLLLLRGRIDSLTTREAIDNWLHIADSFGMDPL